MCVSVSFSIGRRFLVCMYGVAWDTEELVSWKVSKNLRLNGGCGVGGSVFFSLLFLF